MEETENGGGGGDVETVCHQPEGKVVRLCAKHKIIESQNGWGCITFKNI